MSKFRLLIVEVLMGLLAMIPFQSAFSDMQSPVEVVADVAPIGTPYKEVIKRLDARKIRYAMFRGGKMLILQAVQIEDFDQTPRIRLVFSVPRSVHRWYDLVVYDAVVEATLDERGNVADTTLTPVATGP